ncbi:MAG: MFS transporter [Candidatus Pacebacteria bacterium]|nr:MFS transporter [Candidatus Paceibacterota bacterium]MBP9851482.1 MFS transporter [Candidatus Paceibacterota bacterium]
MKRTAANRRIIYLAGFLFSIPIALTSYINSSFLETHLSAKEVSMLYVFASILTVLGMLEMPRILTRFGNRVTTLVFSLFCFLSLILLAFSHNTVLVTSAFVLFFITSNFIFATLDIFVEDFSKNSSVGKLRGLYLVTLNVAWVLSQTISGSILAKSSYAGLYLFGAMFMVLVASIFTFSLKSFVDPKYKKVPVLKTIKIFIRNKNISKIYLLNFILKFFFVWMIIYTPIHLHEHIGFSWQTIGPIFTIMLLPFVFLTYPLGRLSDKIGEKKMLIIGFIIMAIATSLIPLVEVASFWIWAGILFATRVGAATVEIMSESYFFKSVSEEHPDTISFFRNTGPMSFIFAPLVAIPILLFVPSFSYLFFALSAVLLVGLYITLRIKDVK